MPIKNLVGKLFGIDTTSGMPYANGRPIGSPMPMGLGVGKTYYVSSVVGGADGTSPDTACSTIVAATAKCVANQGDTVVVLPYHTENIAAATALSAIAGIRIIGVGEGDARPKVTFTAANTATYSLAVNNVTIENIVFIANFLSIAAAITLTTATGTRVVRCEFRDTSSVLNFLNGVKSTGAANTVDGLQLMYNTWLGLGTTSVNSFLLTANDIDRLVMMGNYVKLARTATAAALATVTAGSLTALDCGFNTTITQATATTLGSLISIAGGGTACTGRVWFNYSQTLTTTSDLLFTTTVGFAAFENRVSGVIGATGFVIPAADS